MGLDLRNSLRRVGAVLAAVSIVSACGPAGSPARDAGAPDADGRYSRKRPADDGIGKVYLGREISFVMGHRGAAWLERPEREVEEMPDRVVEEMDLAVDARVADLGAGSGYFTFRIAARVPGGRVYAVDIQPEMLALVRDRAAARGIERVETVLGAVDDPRLPEGSIDAVLMVDAYHEFEFPYEMMTAVVRALRPGGRVYLIEYRAEDPTVPILPLHKMTEAQARLEMEAVGLRFVENRDVLPTQHFLVFEKPEDLSPR